MGLQNNVLDTYNRKYTSISETYSTKKKTTELTVVFNGLINHAIFRLRGIFNLKTSSQKTCRYLVK